MAIDVKIPGAIAGLVLATGCVTYPYETAFADCDENAGICYQICEEEETAQTPEYSACHAECEAEASQCFATAQNAYQYSDQYSSGYSSYPRLWRGRYGAWYPDRGYLYGFYDRGYGHRRPGAPYGYGSGGHEPYGHPGKSGGKGGGKSPSSPPQTQPPQAQPPAGAGRRPPRARTPGQNQNRRFRDTGTRRGPELEDE